MELNDKTTAEQFKYHMEALIAKMYSQTHSEAVRRGMMTMVTEGYLPTRPPLGYETTKIKGLYAPNRLGRAIGTLLCKLASQELSVNETTAQLKLLIETATGKKMTASKLLQLMANPYYAGILCYQDIVCLGKHTTIITAKQHAAIVQALRNLPENSEGKP